MYSRLFNRKPQYLKQLQHLQVSYWSWFNKSIASLSELLIFFSLFLGSSFKVGWRCNPVMLRRFHSDTRTGGFMPFTVEEGSPSDWINGKRQEMKVLSSQYTCTKEWVAVAHTGMNNALRCLCHPALAQHVSHALMVMEIETDCESEKKLSQNEYVKWVERNDQSH